MVNVKISFNFFYHHLTLETQGQILLGLQKKVGYPMVFSVLL